MSIHPITAYPLPSASALHLQYVGTHVRDLPTPAAIIDRAIVRRNCDAMLEACRALGVSFRVHVKSHKVRS